MDTLSDNAIMLRVKGGDLDRLGLLFERYHRAVYGFLFHSTHCREESEDMVQLVFYRILKYRGSFTGEGAFVTWMYHLARNVLKDHYKKNKHLSSDYRVEHMADWLGGGEKADKAIESEEAKTELYQAMERLQPEHREVLVLSRFQELKYQEIAQILNISEGAVKVRVYRAMKELKEIYAKIAM